jgi:CTP:phosphocholine cytidylyltransferase-like protein
MDKTLNEILPLVKPNNSITEPVVIDGKEYIAKGIFPFLNDGGEKLKKSCTTMSDLFFFLEPPKTYDDLIYRSNTYGLDIQIKFVEK